MMKSVFAGMGALMLAGTAMADVTLQIDANAIELAVKDANGGGGSFSGLNHTGSIDFSFDAGTSYIHAVAIAVNDGAFQNQGFTANLTDFSGSIELVNGVVDGGSLTITVDSGDTYTTMIAAGSGTVQNAATPGGFVIDGMTFEGKFSDAMFGNVDVSDWFAVQDLGQNLAGSFLHFNFVTDPQTGTGHGDADVFVVVPLPPAGLAGAGVLAGLAGIGYIRRRR